MNYYVFRKNVNDGSIKNCEKYEDLEEAKQAAQDEDYYRSHSNLQIERDSWKVVLAQSEADWGDMSTDDFDYEEIDFDD